MTTEDPEGDSAEVPTIPSGATVSLGCPEVHVCVDFIVDRFTDKERERIDRIVAAAMTELLDVVTSAIEDRTQ